MGEAGAARGVGGFVEGGMGGLADALARACEDLGVKIFHEAPGPGLYLCGAACRPWFATW